MLRTISAKKILATAIIVASAFSASAGHAREHQDLCAADGQPGGDGSHGSLADICATGPAGCVAVGVIVDVAPNAALPGGATTQLSRSQTNAFGFNGFGQSHADAAQAKVIVPPTLGAGVVESTCDSFAYADQWGGAWLDARGEAETADLRIDLSGYGIPASLTASVLRENGASTNGFGGNSANVVGVAGSVFGTPFVISNTQAPNTIVPLGPVGTLYLNEQMISPGFCPIYSGDALRLVVTDPTTGATLATIIISWVSTSTCGGLGH